MGHGIEQPQTFDQSHFLLLSEILMAMTWRSSRLASSTPWLCWYFCTYFRRLRKYLLFPASSSLTFSFFFTLVQWDTVWQSLCSMDEFRLFSLSLIRLYNFSSVESWNQKLALAVVHNGAWDWANLEHLINLISCCFQRSWWQWPDGAANRRLWLPGFVDKLVRIFAGYGYAIPRILLVTREEGSAPPPLPLQKRNVPLSFVILFPLSLDLAWFWLLLISLIRWLRPPKEYWHSQLHSILKEKKKQIWAFCMFNIPLSAWFCIWSAPQAVEWNLNFSIEIRLHWRRNVVSGMIYSNQCIRNQPSHCAMDWFCVLVPIHQKARGSELAYTFFLFFFFAAPEALLSPNTHIANENYAKSKVPMHSSVCILVTDLCRDLGNNILSKLPFNIFQELTSLIFL